MYIYLVVLSVLRRPSRLGTSSSTSKGVVEGGVGAEVQVAHGGQLVQQPAPLSLFSSFSLLGAAGVGHRGTGGERHVRHSPTSITFTRLQLRHMH